MTNSAARSLRIGLALALVVLAVNAVLAAWSLRRISENDRWVAHTLEVLGAVSEALSALKDAEDGQRGYLITGDPGYLEPYHAAVAALPDAVGRLKGLTADNPAQEARLDAAREPIERRLARLAEGIRLRRTEGLEAAQKFASSGLGRREMETLRALFAAMEAEETGLLRARSASSRRAYVTALVATVVSAAASFGLIGLIYAIVGRAIAVGARAEALQEADRRKDEFLATLAHELRNPLAAIRAALDSIRVHDRDDPVVRRSVGTIDHQVEHISRLIEDLLDASRIAQGKLLLRREPLELAEALDLAVAIARPLIDARGQQLSVELAPGPLPLEGDRTRLAQVFANLLANAAKYSERGRRIWLEGANDDGWAIVRVRDEGRGIAPEMLPKIFSLYAQEERLRGDAQGGLGIGLSLVKRLAELHGGTIEARSEGPGRGSEFVVRLPLAQARPAPPPLLHAETSHGEQTEAEAETAPTPSRRVLLADDNAEFAEMYAAMLVARGYDVRVAHDGAAAVEAARAFRPDAVLTDLGLPKLDGFGVAERLRGHPETSEVLLIALSGSVRDEDRLRARDVGFDHFLTKPVRFARVEELLSAPRRPVSAAR